ncbi:hypothetical protein [Intestinibacter sp.]|uniref:hypothetical protein n=1 Tax=Intestinibacter sp. TaxID=1965304 RepID=UPI003F192448
MNPKKVKEIIQLLPKDCNPRLGGSYNLYLRGLVDSFRDIDIIIDKGTIDKVNLPFPKIESFHGKGLNKRIKYCINGREVDILESINPADSIFNPIMEIWFESANNVIKAKEKINNYLKELK